MMGELADYLSQNDANFRKYASLFPLSHLQKSLTECLTELVYPPYTPTSERNEH